MSSPRYRCTIDFVVIARSWLQTAIRTLAQDAKCVWVAFAHHFISDKPRSKLRRRHLRGDALELQQDDLQSLVFGMNGR